MGKERAVMAYMVLILFIAMVVVFTLPKHAFPAVGDTLNGKTLHYNTSYLEFEQIPWESPAPDWVWCWEWGYVTLGSPGSAVVMYYVMDFYNGILYIYTDTWSLFSNYLWYNGVLWRLHPDIILTQ